MQLERNGKYISMRRRLFNTGKSSLEMNESRNNLLIKKSILENVSKNAFNIFYLFTNL